MIFNPKLLKLEIICCLISLHVSIYSQELSNSVTCSGGQTFKTALYSLDFVLGEISTESFVTGNNFLTEGFLQDLPGTTSINEYDNESVKIIVYPNPANEILQVKINENAVPAQYEIIDPFGRTIQKQFFQGTTYQVNIGMLQPGFYLLRIKVKNNALVSKQFIKN